MLRLSMASALASLVLLFAPQSASAEMRSAYNSIKWVFPEGGATSGGHPDYHDFQTYYHFANLNAQWVLVEAYFQGDAGAWTTQVWLAPQSRTSVPFSSMSGGRMGFHAAEFYSTNSTLEIQVSSTMFNNGWLGLLWESSKAVNGSTDARPTWSFGEGGIFSAFLPGNQPVFDHFYAVYNPNNTPITVNGKYYPDYIDNGNPPVGLFQDPIQRTVPARSRLAFNPWSNSYPWNTMHARATTIECTPLPCVVQMTMYQRANVGSRRPNTQSSLGSNPATTWYVVGIPTGSAWQHRMYFLNTSPNPNTVRLKYRNAAGADVLNTQHTLSGSSRMSYDLSGWQPGSAPLATPPQNMGGDNLSLEITADAPIVLTKIMYWQGNWDWSEGSNTTGHSTGGRRLVFPGGNSGGGFNNYIQVMNTSGVGTNVTATTYRPNGSVATRNLGWLNGKGMLQIDAGSWGVDGDFTTVIDADQPIIGEAQTMFAWEATMWRAGDSVEAIVLATPSLTAIPIQP
jgi:hypothetical protein